MLNILYNATAVASGDAVAVPDLYTHPSSAPVQL